MAAATNAATAPSQTFRPTDTFRNGPALFLAVGLVATTVLTATRHYGVVPPVAALTIAFLLLTLTSWTLRVEMNADGVTRRWLWGRKMVPWHTVSQMERTGRVWFLPGSLFLLDEKGKELLALAVLSPADQQTVADEAVKRGRLRRDKKPLKKYVLERWVRK